ncbi:MAG: hypothetical protein ACOYJ2_03880, partial [Rickettsiales bacterium]
KLEALGESFSKLRAMDDTAVSGPLKPMIRVVQDAANGTLLQQGQKLSDDVRGGALSRAKAFAGATTPEYVARLKEQRAVTAARTTEVVDCVVTR